MSVLLSHPLTALHVWTLPTVPGQSHHIIAAFDFNNVSICLFTAYCFFVCITLEMLVITCVVRLVNSPKTRQGCI